MNFVWSHFHSINWSITTLKLHKRLSLTTITTLWVFLFVLARTVEDPIVNPGKRVHTAMNRLQKKKQKPQKET